MLDREIADDGLRLLPGDEIGFSIQFQPTQEHKAGPNQMHLHLTSSSLVDQQSMVARALGLGGRHLDVGQGPEDEHVVLADPEVNEFCVIEPGNNFLADCGFVGELTCDGSQQVGYFWSEALGWPLGWDQDQETAIQSPGGGTKISWVARRWRRRPGRTGCTSTSLHRSVRTSRPRSTGSSPRGRGESTSTRAGSPGWCWPIPTATSSAC